MATDVGRADVTAAYQSGMAKSYQINQLFPQLTVRENLRLGALGRRARPAAARYFPRPPKASPKSKPWSLR